eukprot:4656694-Ditylum_brightwellii.AAC.2
MLANSTIPTTNDYKPGGTMNIVQGDIVGQMIESGQDKIGWWVYTKLAAKNNMIITIIMAYQLCKIRLVDVDGKQPSKRRKLYFGSCNWLASWTVRTEKIEAHLYQ